VDRSELCEVIINALNVKVARVLVRAPYSSGKTSLAQLLHRRLGKNNKAYIISLSKANGESWNAYWLREIGIDWAEIATSRQLVYVIIDEVQVSYRSECGAHDLWSIIKDLANSNPQVRFICFGAYGTPLGMLPTPIEFQFTISFGQQSAGMPGMVYTQKEFVDLCTRFAQAGFAIDLKSANFLYYITNGYPGIIGWILLQAYNNFKNSRDRGAAQLYVYLHSANLLNAMVHETCRAIPDFAAHDSSVELVCKQILSAPEFKVAKNNFAGPAKLQLDNCLKASMVIDDGGKISFAAPIIQNKALAYFFGDRSGTKPATLSDFIISVVQRFSPKQLNESESRDTQSRLMEAQWQQEFYRAAGSALPQNVIISPEYGREQGAEGQVDFYIAEYKWMIEILREGLDMAAHERRFEAGGQYETLLDEVDEWAVIDFRGAPKAVRRGARDNTYHFCFAKSFTEAVIRGPGGLQKTVAVLGDKVDFVRSDRVPGGTPSKLIPPKGI